MVMKRIVLLLSLCSLLAITKLSAAQDPYSQLARAICIQDCYKQYKDAIAINTMEKVKAYYFCAEQLSRSRNISHDEANDICVERARARAKEEYEMCLLSCQ
jgi:hypothetical protein